MNKWEVLEGLGNEFRNYRPIAVRYRMLHIVLMMISGLLLANYQREWEIKTSLVGLVALVTLLDFLNMRREGLRSLIQGLDRGQLLMLSLCVILILNVGYMTWVSLGVWLVYLVPLDCSFNDAMFNSKKPENRRQTIGFYVMVHSIFIFWMASLMKYEGLLKLDWKFLMAPIAVIWFVAWFFILIVHALKGLFLALFDGINIILQVAGKAPQKSSKERGRQEHVKFIYMVSLYFVWFLLFADIYLPSSLYETVLNIVTVANTILVFGYLLLGKVVQRYLMEDFLDRHVVHQEGDRFMFGCGKNNNKPIANILPQCMLCSNKVEIIHKNCGKGLMCESCLEKSGRAMNLGQVHCPKCQPGEKRGNFYYIFDKKEDLIRQSNFQLFDYMQKGYFLVGVKPIVESADPKCCIY